MTCGPTGCSRYSNAVTTPKLPPPPRSAQNRSGFSSALARTSSPSAVTTSAASRLSHAGPCLRASQPRPPPSVRPGDAGGRDVAARRRQPVRLRGGGRSRPAARPGPTRAVRAAGSTAIARHRPRGRSRGRRRRPRCRRCCGRRRGRRRQPVLAGEARRPRTTSAGAAQRAISAGRRSTVPFQTRRAPSYAAWSGPISSPANPPSSASVSSSTAHPVGRFARPYPRPRAPGKTA